MPSIRIQSKVASEIFYHNLYDTKSEFNHICGSQLI